MAIKKNTTYEVLNAIPFADKIERKGQFDYLSWANAWDLMKKRYPEAQRTIYENVDIDGRLLNYFSDGRYAYVKIGITIEGIEHIDMLPVMDYKNKSIPVDQMSSIEVNTTIQRSTAKAIAMHGLGIQLWSGEDVASATQPSTKTNGEVKSKAERKIYPLVVGDKNWPNVVKYVEVNKKQGIDKLTDTLSIKYKITKAVTTELNKVIKQ